MHSSTATTNRDYAVGLGRAFAGATIFSLPLLMTLEMWSLGHSIRPPMLLQFGLVNLAMLLGLSRVAGFEATHDWRDDLLDSLAAYAVGTLVSIAGLALFGVFGPDTGPADLASKLALHAFPASFGAMIGARILGEGEAVEADEPWRDTHSGQLFLFAAGALFLSFTIAPTEEVLLISFQTTAVHMLIVVLLSILLLHAMLHVVAFPGQPDRTAAGRNDGHLLRRQTLPAYGIAVLVSAYILWTVGSLDGLDWAHRVMAIAVLAFPGALGAAIARLVV